MELLSDPAALTMAVLAVLIQRLANGGFAALAPPEVVSTLLVVRLIRQLMVLPGGKLVWDELVQV
jgi:hypothetical protein